MNRFAVKIAHPEWLWRSDPAKALELYRSGKLPPKIAGWMMVVGLKHPLRAIYGSDLKAACALLADAVMNKFDAKVTYPLVHVAYWFPYALAWAWTLVWGAFRRVRHGKRPWVWMWGRHDSPEPIRCACGWGGPRRWVVHGYQDDGTGEGENVEVEPVDECPRCGGEI